MEGVTELIDAIGEHISFLEESGTLTARRTVRARNELLAMLNEQIGRYVLTNIKSSGKLDRMIASVEKRENDPYSVVSDILKGLLR